MSVRDGLRRIYWAMQKRLVPGLWDAQSTYERFLFQRVRDGVDWLDVGCGHTILSQRRRDQERVLLGRARAVVGIDPALASLRRNTALKALACADSSRLPFPDASVDLVTANMVVEHLPDPEAAFTEVSRVLRVGGLFIFHTPNGAAFPTILARLAPEYVKSVVVRLKEGRSEDDRFRAFYRCNSEGSIRRLAQRVGFEVAGFDFVLSYAFFSFIPPLAALELLWIKLLKRERLRRLRPNLIVALEKQRPSA